MFYTKKFEIETKGLNQEKTDILSNMIKMDKDLINLDAELKLKQETQKNMIREKEELRKKREIEEKLKEENSLLKKREKIKTKNIPVSTQDLDIMKQTGYWDKEGKEMVEELKKNFEGVLGRQKREKDAYDLDYDKGKVKKVKKKEKEGKRKKKLNFEKFVNMSEKRRKKVVEKREKSQKSRNFKKRYSKMKDS